MNRLMHDYLPTFRMYQSLRAQLMEVLTDEDLAYHLGGANLTLGALCREIGETEHAYIQSFKTFTLDFSHRNAGAGLESSVSRLAAWHTELDRELLAVVESLTDDDLDNRVVARGPDFKVPPQLQLEIYKEALLIFCGKASVYMKALGKSMPRQWEEWIA